MQKVMAFRIDDTFKKNALQEEQILNKNRYFIGRTHWDKSIVNFSPFSKIAFLLEKHNFFLLFIFFNCLSFKKKTYSFVLWF